MGSFNEIHTKFEWKSTSNASNYNFGRGYI